MKKEYYLMKKVVYWVKYYWFLFRWFLIGKYHCKDLPAVTKQTYRITHKLLWGSILISIALLLAEIIVYLNNKF